MDGFAGTEAALTGSFSNIDALVGSTASDTLVGLQAAALWEVGSLNRYISTNTLGFTSIENLTGGSDSDTFSVSATLPGILTGGGGSDVLDFATFGGPVSVVLEGATSEGFGGSGTVTFAGIDRLQGSPALADALTDNTGASAATWTLAAASTYSNGTQTLAFTGFEQLTGGSGADTFAVAMAPAGLVTGGTGIDRLDFTSAPGPVSVVLQGADATGFSGSGTVAFAGIDTVTGTRDTRDTLTDQTGASTTTWSLDADPTFSDGTHTLHFARIEAVTGSQDAQLAFGLSTDTTARDLTLRYNPGTQEVQLVDSATLALVSTDGIALTVDNLVQVAGTAGADVLRIEASVAAAGLAVAFDARGGADALDLDASPGPVTTVLEKTDADGLSGVGPVAFRGIDTLRVHHRQ